MMAVGFGTSFALTGSTATVMGAAPQEYAGAASALFNTARQIGSATGVALGGSLLATGADYGTGLRTSMAIGALAYLTAAVVAWVCVPGGPKAPPERCTSPADRTSRPPAPADRATPPSQVPCPAAA